MLLKRILVGLGFSQIGERVYIRKPQHSRWTI